MTILVFWESIFAAWAPFFRIYGILALAIPLSSYVCLDIFTFGNLKNILFQYSKETVVFGLLLIFWEHGFWYYGYEKWWLRKKQQETNPLYSPNATIELILTKTSLRLKKSLAQTQLLFGAYALLWAPLAESFFYFGYLQYHWEKTLGLTWALSLVILLFGLRHFFNSLGKESPIPWAAAFAFALSAMGSALCLGLLFHRTHSIMTLLMIHGLSNSIWILQSKKN